VSFSGKEEFHKPERLILADLQELQTTRLTYARYSPFNMLRMQFRKIGTRLVRGH